MAEQAREFIPGIEAVAVKEGIGHTAARTDRAVMIPGGERVGARGIRYTAPDRTVAYKVFRLLAHLAGG